MWKLNAWVRLIYSLIFLLFTQVTLFEKTGAQPRMSSPCGELLAATSQDFVRHYRALEDYVDDRRESLISGVNILLSGEFTHHELRENALRGAVCGRTTRILEYFLEQNGYLVSRYSTERLGSSYVTTDHTFQIVTIVGVEVIIDAAYLSFLKVFGSDFVDEVLRKFGPKSDILILPVDHIGKWVDSIVQLRRDYTNHLPHAAQRARLSSGQSGYTMSDDEARSYLLKIWDFRDPIYGAVSSRNLNEDIALFRTAPSLLSPLTQQLIRQLIGKGLIR